MRGHEKLKLRSETPIQGEKVSPGYICKPQDQTQVGNLKKKLTCSWSLTNLLALPTFSINDPDPLDHVKMVQIITRVVFSKSSMKLVYQEFNVSNNSCLMDL